MFVTGTNPVEVGLVAGLNRPGGNLTGVTLLLSEVMAKRIELLHELFPPRQRQSRLLLTPQILLMPVRKSKNFRSLLVLLTFACWS